MLFPVLYFLAVKALDSGIFYVLGEADFNGAGFIRIAVCIAKLLAFQKCQLNVDILKFIISCARSVKGYVFGRVSMCMSVKYRPLTSSRPKSPR